MCAMLSMIFSDRWLICDGFSIKTTVIFLIKPRHTMSLWEKPMEYQKDITKG
jgi:hypothetical protein